jgi:hypothetical protein
MKASVLPDACVKMKHTGPIYELAGENKSRALPLDSCRENERCTGRGV